MKEQSYLDTPLWNSSLSIEERLTYMLGNLTIDEKLQFLGTGCPAVERLGIMESGVGGEAAHGVEARHDQGKNAGEAEFTTSFPQPAGMSSTWDTQLIEEVGAAVGNEARVLFDRSGKRHGLSRWAPTIDMERDPRWGRTEEAYGEDPYLTGKMASAYIRGMRGKDPFYIRCAATLKHFYANNMEQDRVRTSSTVDPRNKYEYYLEPFRRAVTEGRAEGLMTSYNEINGTPGMLNTEVQKLVKDSWGLAGHVVTDGGDVLQTVNDHKYFGSHAQTIAAGLKAGIDCFTDDRFEVEKAAREAFEGGLIGEEDIDRAIRNSFSTRIRLGMFDAVEKNPYAHIPEECLNSRKHQELARKAAEESVVLLKNENNLLPLAGDVLEIAVVGPMAAGWHKDWYSGIPPYTVSPLSGMEERYGKGQVQYASGLHRVRIRCEDRYLGLNPDGEVILTQEAAAEVFELNDWGFGSSTLKAESCGCYLTADADLGKIMGTMNSVSLAGNSVSNSDINTFYDPAYADQLKAGPEEIFGWFIKETFDLRRQNDGSCRIDTWYGRTVVVSDDRLIALGVPALPGTKEAVSRRAKRLKEDADMIRGEFPPEEYGIEPARFYLEIVEDGMKKAVELAMRSDAAVVVLGMDPVINGKEEIDRTDIVLPPQQQELLKAVRAVNPNTVLVLAANYPFAVCWAQENVSAIVTMATGSMEMGHALAAVLAGDVSPAGRLPMTWYKDVNDLPEMDDYDIIKGKRTYQYFEGGVLYPFGHGLSYTGFGYREFSAELVDYVTVCLQLTVENTGTCTSDEVVQIYAHIEESRVARPKRKLAAFRRIRLHPGEAEVLCFEIPTEDLKYYDVVTGAMILESGRYYFEAGASSGDIRLHTELTLSGQEAAKRNPFLPTAADHYDDYDNAALKEGVYGCTSIESKKEEFPCTAVYRDMLFDRIPDNFVVDCISEEDTVMKLYFGQRKAAEFTLRASDRKQFIRRSFRIRDMLPQEPEVCGRPVALTLRVREGVKISRFWFE